MTAAIRPTTRRFSDDQLIQARAMELSSIVGVPLVKKGKLLVGCCPFHVEKTSSFTVFDDNHYHCYGCGAHGDAITFVMKTKGKTFPEAVEDLLGGRAVDPAIIRKSREQAERRDAEQRAETARKLAADWRRWERAFPVRPGDPVWRYLVGRGCLVDPFPEALRFDRAMWHPEFFDDQGSPTRTWPAMLARVDGRTANFVGIHATLLAEAGDGRWVQDPELKARKLAKITHGALMGGAIRLFPVVDGHIGIDEGIENALSMHKMTAASRGGIGLPVWAAPDHPKMAGFEIPADCTELSIFSQRDRPQTEPGKVYAPEGVGMRSARILQQKARDLNIPHHVYLPPAGSKDSNDALQALLADRGRMRAGSVEAVVAP